MSSPTPGCIPTPAGDVSIVVDGPASDRMVVLAHGAGADLNSDFMATMARHLVDHGLGVCRFNFSYMEKGKRAPDRGPVLEDTYAAVAAFLVGELQPEKLILGGKSMGGRIASQIVAAGQRAEGLVFFGYPMHPPGRPERMRDAHLRDVGAPMLFVTGTRDSFCPIDTLEAVRKKLPGPTEVVVVSDGDHSLKVRASSGRSTAVAWAEAASAASTWIKAL